MTRLSYNDEKELAKANPRDLMNFFSMLYADSDFKNKAIFVGDYTNENDVENKLMCTTTIRFQVFGKKDHKELNSRGKLYEWKSYRAKCFSCINSRFINKTI